MSKIILFFIAILFSYASSSKSISEYEIHDKLKIGDSLLKQYSEENINLQVKRNLDFYSIYGMDSTFVEVFFKSNIFLYDAFSFYIKPKDPAFIIYGIGGIKDYPDKFTKCLELLESENKRITKEFRVIPWDSYYGEHPIDPSGKSFNKSYSFISVIQSDNLTIDIECSDFDKSVQTETDNRDFYGTYIYTDEVYDWFLVE